MGKHSSLQCCNMGRHCSMASGHAQKVRVTGPWDTLYSARYTANPAPVLPTARQSLNTTLRTCSLNEGSTSTPSIGEVPTPPEPVLLNRVFSTSRFTAPLTVMPWRRLRVNTQSRIVVL